MANNNTLTGSNLPYPTCDEKALPVELPMTDMLRISLDSIDLNNTQFEYRLQTEDDLTRFSENIKKNGQKIPVLLRGKKPPLQLICGFRRVRSLLKLSEKYVKAIIIPEISNEHAHRLSIIENEERKSFTDLDRANCCKKLIEEGKTQEKVAELLNCSQSQVSKYLSLLKLPVIIFEALKRGKITTYHALILKGVEKIFHVEYCKYSSNPF